MSLKSIVMIEHVFDLSNTIGNDHGNLLNINFVSSKLADFVWCSTVLLPGTMHMMPALHAHCPSGPYVTACRNNTVTSPEFVNHHVLIFA